MIAVAQTRNFTGRNNITLVNNDFMEYDFKDYYDIYFIKQLKIASFFFEVLEKSTSKNAVLTLLLN